MIKAQKTLPLIQREEVKIAHSQSIQAVAFPEATDMERSVSVLTAVKPRADSAEPLLMKSSLLQESMAFISIG